MSGDNGRSNIQDPKARQYFSTLPAIVQETIMQTGIQIHSEKQLRSIVDNMTKSS